VDGAGMRIQSIRFRNVKLLRDATLPLEPLTVIVGPNNSGKTTVLEALRFVAANDVDALRTRRSFSTGGRSPRPRKRMRSRRVWKLPSRTPEVRPRFWRLPSERLEGIGA
jgi:ABC-type branched-subunit amino acid transport system ATPase component